MKTALYTYIPKNFPKWDIPRGSYDWYGNCFSEITGLEYLGLLNLQRKSKLTRREYLLPMHKVGKNEAVKLGIKNGLDLYGFAGPTIYANKSILHPLFNEKTSYCPSEFPRNLGNKLYHSGITVEGYTVFDKDSLLKAFELLHEDYSSVRVKETWQAGGLGQYSFTSLGGLKEYINTVNTSSLRKFGIVLEAEIRPQVSIYGEEPLTVSAGLISLLDQKYCYLGVQKISKIGPLGGYYGTRVYISKDFAAVLDSLPRSLQSIGKTVADKALKTVSIIESDVEGKFICSRYNLDFVCGTHEQGNSVSAYLTDQGFALGDASAAEFHGIKAMKTKNLRSAISECTIEVLPTTEIPESEEVVFDGSVTGIGRVRFSVGSRKD